MMRTSLHSPIPSGRQQAREIERQRGNHQKTWIAALVFGLLLILAGNWLGFDQWIRGWFVAILLSVPMLVYFLTARTAEHVSADTKGDAFYYLGLLFTFGSLVSALVSFSRTDDIGEMNALIAPFGIALVTTIVGLFGRVWFSVWQDSAGDAVAGATRALDEAIVDMKAIVVRGSQSMEDLVDNLGASANSMEATAVRIAAVAEKAAGTADTLDEYSAGVVKLARSFTDGATEFNHAVTGVTSGVSTLKEPLEEARGRLDALGADLLVLGEAVEQARASVSQLDRAGRDGEREIAGMASRAESVQQEMEKMRKGFAETTEFFGRVPHTASTIDEHVARIGSSVGGLAEKVGRLQEAAVMTADAVSAVAPRIEGMGASVGSAASELQVAKSHAASLGESLSELSDVAVQGRQVVTSRVGDLEKRLDGVGTETAATIGRASGRADSVAGDLDNLRDQLTETQKELSRIIRDSAAAAKKLRRGAQGKARRRLLFWRRG